MPRTAVSSPTAPAAIGPYSHAVLGGGLLFLSGQSPIDPVSGEVVGSDVETQTRRVLDNLAEVLQAAGCGLDDVVKLTVYLASLDDFDAMNDVYRATFAAPFPARTTVEVAGLPLDARVEIECVAAMPD